MQWIEHRTFSSVRDLVAVRNFEYRLGCHAELGQVRSLYVAPVGMAVVSGRYE